MIDEVTESSKGKSHEKQSKNVASIAEEKRANSSHSIDISCQVANLIVLVWHFLAWIIVLAVVVSLSPRVQYWTRMIVYFIGVQLVSLILLPIALLDRGNPTNFRYATGILAFLRGLFGIRWQLHGQENVKDKAYVIVSNHQSSLDALGMVINWDVFHPVVPVMKDELRYALAFGLFCRLSGAVFVTRGSEKGRIALSKALQEAKRTKVSLWIFPEGTRNHSNSILLPFKKGAFHIAIQGQLPVLPVVFSRYGSFYSKTEQRFESGRVSVTVLPEISTCGLTSQHVNSLCEQTRNVMREFIAAQNSDEYDDIDTIEISHQ